jgi:hypothetical protein
MTASNLGELMNTYEVCVALGDGKPIRRTIQASTGLMATVQAFNLHPTARVVHLLRRKNKVKTTLIEEPKKVTLSFGDPPGKSTTRDLLLPEAVRLRVKGWSYSLIAKELGIGKTTVRTWLTTASIY